MRDYHKLQAMVAISLREMSSLDERSDKPPVPWEITVTCEAKFASARPEALSAFERQSLR